jgi:hypothetical protein
MREKEKHIIKLNRYFYNKQAIEETKKEFNGVCTCDIEETGGYFLVSVIPKESDVNTLHFEFANYVLALMK